MRTTKSIATAVLLLSGLVAASQSLAQEKGEKGFYLGGSVGQSKIDSDIAFPGLISSGTVDGKDTGFKVFGGYQFNQYFGLDLAWVDLGEASYRGSFFGTPVTGGTVKLSGLNFSAVGTIPLNPSFALFGKLGVFAWNAKSSDTTGGFSFSATDKGADLSVGLGASYNFTKNVGVRLEWERFKVGGGDDAGSGAPNVTSSANVDLLSLGLVYKF